MQCYIYTNLNPYLLACQQSALFFNESACAKGTLEKDILGNPRLINPQLKQEETKNSEVVFRCHVSLYSSISEK